MTDFVHRLVEQYGLFAVFIGCVAEGESVAMLAGFFAHQHIFVPWQAFATVFLGAFLGDCGLFLAGRRFAAHPRVLRMKARPGFSRAHNLIEKYPNLFVLFNRYVYGFRAVGGIAAGLSSISMPRFLALNAISSLIWASLFCALGYLLGLSAERIIGEALLRHERLLIGLALGIVVAATGGYVAHRMAGRART